MEKLDVSQAAKRIRLLMQEKKYREVVKIADSLNLNRINNGLLILDIVEAYERTGDKKAAKQALLNYYDVHGITGRNMMQKLIELCIETRDISNAVGLCMEFENEWPESSISYLMRYQITTSAGGSLAERIYYLEKYKEAEFEERWGYELAKLYDKNNQKEKCAEVCHELICFFGTGKYVEKAVQLKERTTGLTEDEINIVETAKHREEEERERREEEERLAREEMARLEEEHRNREYEERRIQEEQYRRREEPVSDRYKNSMSGGTVSGRYEYDMDLVPENGADEAYAAWRARQAEAEKIRQTEEAARLLKEKKEADRIAREQKISEALKVSDRYAQIEKNKSESIYFDEIITNQKAEEDNSKSKKNAAENGGIFSSFGRMASNVKKTLQPDEDYLEKTDADAEIEYITIGRETRTYIEDVEGRMLSELDMLDDEQIDELSSTQIKEIYELKILHDVRENIKELIEGTDNIYQKERSQEEQEKSRKELGEFVDRDPYVNPLERNKEDGSEEEETAESAEATEAVKKAGPAEPVEEENTEPTEAAEEEKTAEPTEAEEEKTAEPTEAAEEVKTAEPTEAAEEEKTAEPTEAVEEAKDEESIETLKNQESVEPSEAIGEEESIEPSEVTEASEAAGSSGAIGKEESIESSEVIEEAKLDGPAEEKETAGPTESEKNSEPQQIEVKQTILDRISDPDENLSVKEFSECITAYAETKGYQIEDSAYITIAVLADEMQQKDTSLSANNAKILVDDAIKRIQKRNPLDKIVDRYSKKHAYLLKDKHFYWKY